MFDAITGNTLRAYHVVRTADLTEHRRTKRRHATRKTAALLTVACCWLAIGHCQPLSADVLATGEMTAELISPGTYQYDITLDDIGTTNIATFWYAWIPGDGFLHSQPTNIVGPAGWGDTVTNSYAIRWEDSATPLTSGNSLSGFQFDSVDTPSQIFGLSQAFPTMPVGTSVVYAIAPPAGSSDQLVVTPERGTLVLLGVGTLGLLLAAWRGRKRARPGALA
ncbi:MAG TPA: hypothetical protein VHY91_12300 [Pirellulales bacterium]|jgi:hypothetical protein|nr:hypothetical protein [Pirellulales bacterium]